MLRVIFAPVRFTVFVLLGALVLSVTNCVPEQGDTNPHHFATRGQHSRSHN